MQCPLCESNDSNIIYKDYPGYLEKTTFDIYKCNNCNSHFVDSSKINKDIYQKVYNDSSTEGYDRYYQYGIEIKSKENPLKFLGYSEEAYYPIYKFFKNKTGLDILEIGCGYGYTSYAIRKQGNNVIGLDISQNAIKFANTNFGNFHVNFDVDKFVSDKKFDVIIATEVFEHLENPYLFVKKIKEFLKKDGKILMTTPNKDFTKQNKKAIWQNDFPPLHLFWATKDGLEKFAVKSNLNLSFIDYDSVSFPNRNPLVEYRRTYKEIVRENNPKDKIDNLSKKNSLKNIILKFLGTAPIRYLSAFYLYKILRKEEVITMGFILENK